MRSRSFECVVCRVMPNSCAWCLASGFLGAVLLVFNRVLKHECRGSVVLTTFSKEKGVFKSLADIILPFKTPKGSCFFQFHSQKMSACFLVHHPPPSTPMWPKDCKQWPADSSDARLMPRFVLKNIHKPEGQLYRADRLESMFFLKKCREKAVICREMP